MPFAFYDRLAPRRRRIYDRSDAIVELPLPPGDPLDPVVASIRLGLERDRTAETRRACQALIDALCERFEVPSIRVKVYPTRPSGDWGELHGMYRPGEDGQPTVVEVWMRTAQQQKVVAPRTFLRTLLHEFCHHLDYEHFGLEETFHTEGFYKRESHLLTQLAGPSARRPPAQDSGPESRPGATDTGTRSASAQSSS
ncbi:MAG: hypothetical protein U1F52_04380 [Burkholderiales bacterium]